jgi:DNA-directed RNA polymerase subunit RPC12/RpoP
MLLREYLETHEWILRCPKCNKRVYKYVGVKPIPSDGIIMAHVFKSLSKKFPNPAPGQKMTCPYCGTALGTDAYKK